MDERRGQFGAGRGAQKGGTPGGPALTLTLTLTLTLIGILQAQLEAQEESLEKAGDALERMGYEAAAKDEDIEGLRHQLEMARRQGGA